MSRPTSAGKAILVGGGVSALMAAWELLARDVEVVLLSPTSPGRWPTLPAGGLPLGEEPETLVAETLACGEYRAARAPVRTLAQSASALVERLASIGVPFETEKKSFRLRRLPGMAEAGAVFVGTHTETAIASALERLLMARYGERLTVREPRALSSLIVVDGRCVGVVCRDPLTHAFESFTGDVVLLAGGAPERLVGARTGHLFPEGPLAIAARHGVLLVDMHLCQTHPAALMTGRGLVVPSPAVRSEGARLWSPKRADDEREPQAIPNKERSRYLEELYPDWAELVPDRIAAREAWAQQGDLYLDLSHFPAQHLQERLPAELEALRLASRFDPSRSALSVAPAPVGLLGGLWVDHERGDEGALVERSIRNHATSLTGLYAAGPLASLYHGTCSLGGNGLLADVLSGSLAGISAEAFIESAEDASDVDGAAEEAVAAAEAMLLERVESGFGPAHSEIEDTLRAAVTDLLGPQEYVLSETADEIDEAEAQLAAMPPQARGGELGATQLITLEDMLLLGKVVARSVLMAQDGAPGRLLARWRQGEIELGETLEVDGRTLSGVLDEDGLAPTPNDYGRSA